MLLTVRTSVFVRPLVVVIPTCNLHIQMILLAIHCLVLFWFWLAFWPCVLTVRPMIDIVPSAPSGYRMTGLKLIGYSAINSYIAVSPCHD